MHLAEFSALFYLFLHFFRALVTACESKSISTVRVRWVWPRCRMGMLMSCVFINRDINIVKIYDILWFRLIFFFFFLVLSLYNATISALVLGIANTAQGKTTKRTNTNYAFCLNTYYDYPSSLMRLCEFDKLALTLVYRTASDLRRHYNEQPAENLLILLLYGKMIHPF